jgi:hypothetical protein
MSLQELERNQADAEEIEENSRTALPKDMIGDLTGLTLRSRGTVQHDVFEWTDHQESFSDGSYTLAVASFEKWGRSNPPSLPFAVVVRLEDLSRTVLVYSEVQNMVSVEAEAKASS